jgi:hypothetical protein
MKQKQTKEELFAKAMSRKDFLRFIALGIFAAFGVNNFIGFLNDNVHNHRSLQVSQKTSKGFGSSRFGV